MGIRSPGVYAVTNSSVYHLFIAVHPQPHPRNVSAVSFFSCRPGTLIASSSSLGSLAYSWVSLPFWVYTLTRASILSLPLSSLRHLVNVPWTQKPTTGLRDPFRVWIRSKLISLSY